MPNPVTILCIDDHQAILKTLPRVLETAGFNVISATNAADGLEALHKNAIDVVLLDHSLAVVDGSSVPEIIKLISPNTVVLFHSGNLELAGRLPRGVDGFIPKPTRPPELIAKVNACLGIKLAS